MLRFHVEATDRFSNACDRDRLGSVYHDLRAAFKAIAARRQHVDPKTQPRLKVACDWKQRDHTQLKIIRLDHKCRTRSAKLARKHCGD